MSQTAQDQQPTVPPQPEAKTPIRKGYPLVLGLMAIVALIAISNLSSLINGSNRKAPRSSLPMRPTSPNAQQVSSFTAQQQLQAERDAEELRRKQELELAQQELEREQSVPSPESSSTPPMTGAQRDQIYGGSSNAPQHTSDRSEAQALFLCYLPLMGFQRRSQEMTSHIKGFFQTLLSTFDHYSEITWATLNDSMTTAMFSAAGMNVTVRFSPLNASCLVDYQVTEKRISTTECVRSSLSVYSGVLQALRTFHRVHGPVAYRFASDDDALAELWDAYRECPRPMGHESTRTFAH